MKNKTQNKKYWFKPKKYGYGAYPSSFEGFVLVIGYILAIYCILAIGLISNPNIYITLIIILTASLFIISKNKTDGEWKWRWGKKN